MTVRRLLPEQRSPLLLIVLGCLLFCVLTSRAEESPALLRSVDVLSSAQQHFPRIIEGLAERRAAQARVLAAEGAFDLVFGVEGYGQATGFYDSRSLEGTATRRLQNYGAEVYGGYQVSNGDFPVYEDSRFTNSGGKLELGVLFSLLRDRDIDKERFLLKDTALSTQAADFDVLLTRIGVAQQALVAYWRWVALGHKRRVYEELLDIAMTRQLGLEQEVRQGAKPQIVLTENLQNITQRKSLLATSQRDFDVAANELSLYYRDINGETLTVTDTLLPDYSPVIDSVTELPAMLDMDQTIKQRPEVLVLKNSITRTLRRIELNENEQLPQLDLKLEMAQPLGTVAEGGISRDETDVVIGLQFSIPLEMRAARGALAESQAKLSALRQKERLLQDQIQLEITNILLNLRTSQELLQLAKQEVEQSKLLREAEIKRYQQGASDFFLVNIREQTEAEARIRYFLAGMQREIAQANFDAAMVNLPRLGISDY